MSAYETIVKHLSTARNRSHSPRSIRDKLAAAGHDFSYQTVRSCIYRLCAVGFLRHTGKHGYESTARGRKAVSTAVRQHRSIYSYIVEPRSNRRVTVRR